MSEPVWKTLEITFMHSASQDAELFAAFMALLSTFESHHLFGIPLDRKAVARCAFHLLKQFEDEGSALSG